MLSFAALSVAAILGTNSLSQVPELATPTAPLQLAYTHTARTEVAFLDLNSLERSGDLVQAWGFYVLAEPIQTFAPFPADVYWARISLDCAARTGRFTHAIAIVDGVIAFNAPVTSEPTPTQGAWALDAAYACDGETPARPVVADTDAAILASREIMASDAWGAED
ncbi:hypothetical protein [Brevundimonas sp. SL161]|uniref:hypothetical protein n=1 Tax=Brevundimonas sp. SL161 TaxID=2804613 RepID=UPI003CEA3B46